MKTLIIFVTISLFLFDRINAQETYTTNSGHVSFFASAPVADVDAHSAKAKVVLNTSTGDLTVNVDMASFQFKNKKMGRDARKNYIEIDKFPQASFVGKIAGEVNYSKPGSYAVTASGKLKVHGTEREVSEKGTIVVKDGQISIQSQFNVALKDHNIETPQILGKEMTENNVRVKIEATLQSKKKQ